MTKISTLAALGFTAAAAFLIPTRAHAACNGVSVVPGTTPASCDVGPSMVWYTGKSPNGINVELRCAYKLNDQGLPILDTTYYEYAAQNNQTRQGGRLQKIDGNIVSTKATNLNPGAGNFQAQIEVLTTEGNPVKTQNCTIHSEADQTSNCTTTEPFLKDTKKTVNATENAERLCQAYVGLLVQGSGLERSDYDPNKARESLKKLRLTLSGLTQ